MKSQMLRSCHAQSRPAHAFTLIELLVVIAVNAVLVRAILVPLTDALANARRTVAQATQFDICKAIVIFQLDNERFPRDLVELIEAGLVSGFYTTPNGEAVKSTYVFELIFDQSEIEEHIRRLEGLGEIGAESARHLRDLQTEFLIYARPIVPGKTGCSLLYMGDDCAKVGGIDPDCVELQIEMFRRIETESLRLTAKLLTSDPDAAVGVLPLVQSSDVKQGSFDIIDTDSDGKVTIGELRELTKTSARAAENADSTDDPQALLREFLRYVLFDELQIGAASEEIDDVGVTYDELTGDPAEFFSPDNYAQLIDSMIESEGVANALAVKLYAAEAARIGGEENPEEADELRAACAEFIEDFRHQLSALSGKKIAPDDALLLDVAAGVLCPDVVTPPEPALP